MTETAPTHSEDPAEGADPRGTDDAGRTPHPDQPAEGADEADAASGVDPANRISGA